MSQTHQHGNSPPWGNSFLRPYFGKRLAQCELFKTVAIVGSAPSAVLAKPLVGDQTIVVAVNNAWRALAGPEDSDYIVYAGDLPDDAKPPPHIIARKGRSVPHYWPAMNACGGLLYCGASMSFAAGYWAIQNLPFSQISFFASDMIYSGEKTHFYGKGQPDPLRRHISLQDLTASTLRLLYFGLCNGCLIVNASAEPETRLAFPRVLDGRTMSINIMALVADELTSVLETMHGPAAAALALEASSPFDPLSADYIPLMRDELAWSHIASVNAYWRQLEPLVARLQCVVDVACVQACER